MGREGGRGWLCILHFRPKQILGFPTIPGPDRVDQHLPERSCNASFCKTSPTEPIQEQTGGFHVLLQEAIVAINYKSDVCFFFNRYKTVKNEVNNVKC